MWDHRDASTGEKPSTSALCKCHLRTSPQLTCEPQGSGYASRSLYEGFLPKPANFIVQGCGDMELGQVQYGHKHSLPSQ